ncbi:DotG/IcmE/VirB10 family protein [Pandoraea sp. ISTKB]|uniref:DotG/IcmE/VirB10 family protein n=1 Tax=Pandoraea sp. ISTKB TaxID=1586708 RepID=UPI000846754E|nr:DotG/IcmE/VirB10 family protein [Pandoraea sp. ISTKB]ODP35058.1 hypothetical protein A9762_11895 [Pandoraea sp. ISTKB]
MSADNTTEFDPDRKAEQDQQLKAIKRANLSAVFGQGKGRVSAIVVGSVLLGLAVLGLKGFFVSSPVQQPTALPNAAPTNVGGMQGDQMVTSEQEAELRRQRSAQEAQQAAKSGQPYTAPPVLMASKPTAPSNDSAWGGFGAGQPAKAPTPQDQLQAAQQAQINVLASAATAAVVEPKPAVNVKAIADGLKKDNGDVSSQLDYILGVRGDRGDKGQGQTSASAKAFTTGYYPSTPKQEATVGAKGVQAGAAPAMPNGVQSTVASDTSPNRNDVKIKGLEMGVGFYCKLKFGSNSDLVRKDVFATCYGGAADQAVFKGKAEPSAEGVADPGFTVTFSAANFPKYGTLPVDAIAFDNETLEAGIQDEVSTHGFTKFGGTLLAGLLKGVGNAMQIVPGTSNTQTVGNVSTTSISVTRPDLAQIGGNAAGGVGQALGDYIQKRSDSLKTTIKIYPGKEVGIVLLQDVTVQKN